MSDRAEGENWLQRQDISSLLRESETLRDIGPAGWCQLRVSIAPESPRDVAEGAILSASASKFTTDTEPGTAANSAITLTGKASTGKLNPENPAQDAPGTPILESGGKSGTTPSAAQPFCLTFFYNRKTETVRWSLSPRSALETPRTPRREAYRANHNASLDSNLRVSEVDGAEEAGSGTDWERVEDGDMVFYYNRSMGISSWEPPAAWDVGGV